MFRYSRCVREYFAEAGQLGKGRFLEVVWHLSFQCCGEVLGCGYDCVNRGDGWVGDFLMLVKKCVEDPIFCHRESRSR